MSETIKRRLEMLRASMREKGIDAYLIPTDDFHSSEYVGDFFKCRKYITGFTGSAGTAVILKDQAGLWTDGRYFIQAADQLEGSTITLYKMGEPEVPTVHEFLMKQMEEGQCLGFDGRTVGAREADELEKKLSDKNISLRLDLDLVGDIWEERPELSCEPVMELELKWCGQSRTEKCANLRTEMKKKGADVFLLTCLDDIAWLLNIRGNDVRCNPVVLSYLAVTETQMMLFANKKAFPEEVRLSLQKDGITIRPYEEVYQYAASLAADKHVLLCKGKVNSRLVRSIPERVKIIDEENPTLLPKAIKNPTEVENEKIAHIKDGVAVSKFIYWLKKNVGKIEITEISAAEKLFQFRSEQEHFMGNSFEPIISYGSHAAIVHYSATPETDIALQAKGMLLADTGGQYLEGTTDITRTIVLGPVTEEEKTYFTAVLRGHLNLAAAKFRYGCRGVNLDYIARQPLWDMGADYNHGTGHGVGYFLNVHEGPNGIRWKSVPGRNDGAVFEEGMITSNEPGYYAENKFGIRHENLVICKKSEHTGVGQFMCFENLTMVPFDMDGIDTNQMSAKEKERLNIYHKTVYDTIGSYLNEEEREWLKEATRAV